MKFTVEERDTYLLVTFEGNVLDAVTNEALFKKVNEALMNSGLKNCLVDLSAVEFINSTAIAVFTRLHTKMTTLGGKSVIFSPIESVNKLFRLTKLDTVLSLVDKKSLALASF